MDAVSRWQRQELSALKKVKAKAVRLMEADPRLTRTVAWAMAAERMPVNFSAYLEARSHLTLLGVRGFDLNEVWSGRL